MINGLVYQPRWSFEISNQFMVYITVRAWNFNHATTEKQFD